MGQYIAKRLLLGLLSLLGATVIIFGILRILPGDPALMILYTRGETDQSGQVNQKALADLRKRLGTDKPYHVQYFTWIDQVVTGNFGRSMSYQTLVADELRHRIPFTFQLAFLTVLLSSAVGITLGVVSAIKQNTVWDYAARFVAIGGITIPVFFTATLMILVLSRVFSWIPPLGYVGLWKDPLRSLSQIIWPVIALGYFSAGLVSRLTRAQVLEILRQDYVRTARSKGLHERIVLLRHTLRNAMLPVITIIGLQFASLMGGTVIIETIFYIPGMGSAFVDAIRFRDYPMVQSLFLVFAAIMILANLVVDLLYSVLDPRIRYA